MMLGEVSPGGVGVGLNGLLILALLVGVHRRPHGRAHAGVPGQEDPGPRDEARRALHPRDAGGGPGLHRHRRSVLDTALASRLNPGPHGFSEILYAFASAGNNNGSAFGGLTGNTQWYNTTLGVAMLVGRFFLIIPTLALAGSLGRKRPVPVTAGTFPTDTPLFGGLVVGVTAHRRRPHVLPGAGARSHRRAARPVGARLSNTSHHRPRRRSASPASGPPSGRPRPGRCSTRPSPGAPSSTPSRKLDPRIAGPQPGHVHRRDRLDPHDASSSSATSARSTSQENVFAGLVALFLWFTVLFANFAEAMAEGRGQGAGRQPAQDPRRDGRPTCASPTARSCERPSSQLAVGDLCVVTAGEVIPGDGEIVEGIASVDESAITGESAPVIRESGGDRSAVTGGTRVLSDEIVVRITAKPGETFLDRMIALVEGANRQKTPNEIALNILLAGLTIIFLLAIVTLQPFAIYSGAEQTIIVLVALLVCLIPTTIGGLLSAIGIAGMDRLVQRNVLAMSGRAVEAAGDCSTLLLDKTGTITDRQPAGHRVPSRLPAWRPDSWPRWPCSSRWPTRRPRVARSSPWPRTLRRRPGTARRRRAGALHRPDPHVGRRPRRPPDPQGRGRLGAARGCRSNGGAVPSDRLRHRRRGSPAPAARRSWSPTAPRVPRRHRAEGHREARHARALRPDARRWASAP